MSRHTSNRVRVGRLVTRGGNHAEGDIALAGGDGLPHIQLSISRLLVPNLNVNSGNDTSRNQRIAYGFKSFRPIVDDGVLISSPFGKGIRVRFVNMSSGQTLASGSTAADTLTFADAIHGAVRLHLGADLTS
eukprot:COSAG01_NODE_280_length_19520_cov_9.720406_8_plen_132_part_00